MNGKLMKKATFEKSEVDEMRPEYDFRGAVRGKHYKSLHKGYTVRVHKLDGTTVVKHFELKDGAVMLEPDVRQYFPDSESVNAALRSLIDLVANVPDKSKSLIQKKQGRKDRKRPGFVSARKR